MGNERKGLLGVIVGAVVSLCRGAKTRVRMGSKPSEKFLVWVGFSSRICVVSTAFCSSGGCGLGGCGRKIDR